MPKKTEKQYTERDMQEAVAVVLTGAGRNKTAQKFGILPPTLTNRLRGAQSTRAGQEYNQSLSPAQEDRLTAWCLTEAEVGRAKPYEDIRRLAQRVLRTTSGDPKSELGKGWITRFIARYPELCTKRTRRMDFARVEACTPEVVKEWFKLFRIPAIRAIPPENRWNFDETGIIEGRGSNGLVVGATNTREV